MAKIVVTNPVKMTARISAGPATELITAGIANMPDPMILPTPIATSVQKPTARFNPALVLVSEATFVNAISALNELTGDGIR
jgi:hypothetical protein